MAVWLVLAAGCGPTVTLDPEDTTGDEPTTGTTTSAVTTQGPSTQGPGTSPPPDEGPLDEGPLDSGFAEPLDMGIPDDCSLYEQDCPRGYKCMPWSSDGSSSWNDTKCVPIAEDPSAPEEPCTVEGNGVSGIDDCDGTSMCWDVDPVTLEGVCVPFCIGDESDPSCANECDQCQVSGDGVLALCLLACDPLAQDCAPGQACYPINFGFTCAPDASPEGAEIGTPCEYLNGCPPGLACLNGEVVPGCAGRIGCCAPFCPVGGADICPGLLPGTTCVPVEPDGGGTPEGCVTAEPGFCVIP
ncbi:MAG: hypothetical protein KDK70_02380 [Myxococcales bacterium]|nr:hypothetical protein [Myxococcales bacterium]